MKTLNELSVEASLRGETFRAPYDTPLSLELAFTNTYREHQHASVALREAECLKIQFPAILQEMREGDLLAGRIRYPLVGFSPESMGVGYYCRDAEVRKVLEKFPFTPADRRRVEEMLQFWRTETTTARTRAASPETLRKILPSDAIWESGIAFPLFRMAGMTLDFEKLLRLGIPGLKKLIDQKRSAADGESQILFEGMATALDVLKSACLSYASEARAKAAVPDKSGGPGNWEKIAATLEAIVARPPETLREAAQLVWLYALLSGIWNYGRMDVYLGTFLANDLKNGNLTRAEALGLLQSLWRLMKDYENQFNNRVIIGGKGRANEREADEFALLAIEATRTVPLNQPQLSLRFHRGQNPALMEQSLTVLGEGRTFPILYNDDINIPAVMQAFSVDEETAAQYLPYGCGEYVLDHRSAGTPNGVINLLKCLEVTLHNGSDPVTGTPRGLATGDLAGFHCFDDLWAAYTRQVEHHVEALARHQKIEYEQAGTSAPFLLISMLFDDCIERQKAVFAGGARHMGGTLESYGNVNASDSLVAIRRLVYQEKTLSLRELVGACDRDFAGHEKLQQRLLALPKFGNDTPEADEMAMRVHDHICRFTSTQAKQVGLDSYLAVIINNAANSLFGLVTAASADGRKSGETLANAINPQPGRDRLGTTAFLNSLAKLDPRIHAGAVHNMKFSRGLFLRQRAKLEALLAGYFRQGGTQAMLTVVNRKDLEEAMREPEKWGHLMVRVGGFSARFIDLPREAQLDVLERTLNE